MNDVIINVNIDGEEQKVKIKKPKKIRAKKTILRTPNATEVEPGTTASSGVLDMLGI